MSMEPATYFVISAGSNPVELTRRQILDQYPDRERAEGISVWWKENWMPLWDIAQQWEKPLQEVSTPISAPLSAVNRRGTTIVSFLQFIGVMDVLGAVVLGALAIGGRDMSAMEIGIGCLVSALMFFAFAAAIDLLSRIEVNTRK